MEDDDLVCLCFGVSKRKIVHFIRRRRPARPSQISECLSAGTGCGWCVPFIANLYRQVTAGSSDPDLPISPAQYAKRRSRYRRSGQHEGDEAL